MNKKGSYPFEVLAMHVDFQGQLPVDRITDLFIQAASRHAIELGFGADFMQSNNMAWVLSRLAIDITKFPGAGSQLLVSTWIHDQGNLFTNRNFRITTEDNELIAEAVSVWAILDLNSRRPKRLDKVFKQDYTTSVEGFKAVAPQKIESVGNPSSKSYRNILYSDLDMNNHMNSIRYINWVLDLFPLDQYNTSTIKRVVLNYLSEGHYGEELQIKSRQEEENTTIDFYNLKEQKSLFRAVVSR